MHLLSITALTQLGIDLTFDLINVNRSTKNEMSRNQCALVLLFFLLLLFFSRNHEVQENNYLTYCTT